MRELGALANDRVSLAPTPRSALSFVLATERDPDNAPFLHQWSEAEHGRAIDDASVLHALIHDICDGRPVGYLILAGLSSPHRSCELVRLVVADKRRGLGRAALRLVQDLVLAELGMHRLWLDVLADNDRARRLYESEGFVVEGVARDAYLRDGRFVALVYMAILAAELQARRAGGG